MRHINIREGNGSKSFRQMKADEYRAVEYTLIRPAARKMFQHKPYSNDFGRNDTRDENAD